MAIPKNAAQTVCTDPEWHCYGDAVLEFRLTYEGLLHGSNSAKPRAKHKHEIRKALHPQLKRLWQVHPVLKDRKTDGPGITPEPFAEVLSRRFPLGNYNFVPLVTDRLNLACGLHVLFLRPQPPGEVLQSGDIDNRLKTLFDALRRPTDMAQLGGYDEPDESERPFYCLLQDDSLVSQISVDTDVLLQEVNGGFDMSAARLVITVTLKPYIATWENSGF